MADDLQKPVLPPIADKQTVNITMITEDPNAAAKLSLKIKIAAWQEMLKSFEAKQKKVRNATNSYISQIGLIKFFIDDLTQIQSQIKI